MKFQEVIDAVLERAQILKAQGKTSRPAHVVKVAAASTNVGNCSYSSMMRHSPPKVQQPLPTKVVCAICQLGHEMVTCGRLAQMTVEKRLEELRRRGMCFNCMTSGHVSRFCDKERAKCGSCGKPHHTLLHIEGRVPTGRRVQVGGGNERSSMRNDDNNQVNDLSRGDGVAPLDQLVTEERAGGEIVGEEIEEGSN